MCRASRRSHHRRRRQKKLFISWKANWKTRKSLTDMRFTINRDDAGFPAPEDNTGCGVLIFIGTVLVMWAVSSAMADGAGLESLRSGTVLVSRNADERGNTSPGYWNHLASVSVCHVVEAQIGRGVIRTGFDEFEARGYSKILALEPRDEQVGGRAAAISATLVGLPFRQLSSLPGVDRPLVFEARGLNCDSVVRYSYRQASGERLRRLRIPDRALNHDELFFEPVTLRNEPEIATVAMRRRVMVRPAVRV